MHSTISRLLMAFAVLLIVAGPVSAQEELKVGFMNPTYQFSKKKTSYVTLNDGTEIIGNVKDFDRKKGVTDYIKIKGDDGKTYKLDADEIKHGYFHPTALSSMSSFFDDLKIQHWGKDLNQERFKDGYVYLETTKVQINKKKVQSLLMELLNPHFSDGISVYFDPFAKETMSIGIGPAKLGGDAKSYYVKKTGDDIAIRLKKKDYKEAYPGYFGDCDAVLNSGKVRWLDFAEHAYLYATECVND